MYAAQPHRRAKSLQSAIGLMVRIFAFQAKGRGSIPRWRSVTFETFPDDQGGDGAHQRSAWSPINGPDGSIIVVDVEFLISI